LKPEFAPVTLQADRDGCDDGADRTETGTAGNNWVSKPGVACMILKRRCLRRAGHHPFRRREYAVPGKSLATTSCLLSAMRQPPLWRRRRLIREHGWRPQLVIGLPVGFVGTCEAKADLKRCLQVPRITNSGTRGGSPWAARRG